MAHNWYVIHVYSGLEKKVAASIKEQAEAKGMGSIAVDGVMIDVASIRMLQPVLQMADLIEAVHGKGA